MRTISTKLMATFLAVIVALSLFLTLVGVRFIGSRIVAEAQSKVATDLNSAREIYLGHLQHVYNAVRFAADRTFLREGLAAANIQIATPVLLNMKERERLDILTVTDKSGRVLLRTSNLSLSGDDRSGDELVHAVLERKEPVTATTILSAEELRKESPPLAERAYFKFIETPKAKPRPEIEETAGMMLQAAVPIFDYQNRFIGVVYGGILLNRNFEIVDKIKQTVFQDVKYKGSDIGTATIFQDDLRVATNVRNRDGSRAVGTRAAEDVYRQVVEEGKSWVARAYVVNNWYITAYEPIRDVHGRIIGMLYVGILEQKYVDMQRRSTLLFLGITVLAALASTTLAYYISQKISGPIRQLVAASSEVAHGNLDARVEVESRDELRQLADAFNSMGAALKARDQQLKEFAKRKIMESERLAIVGQLAANVAHELNNPLQGIVSYSHLLLEGLPPESPTRDFIERIVVQANRCTTIVRGLLDFSRPRAPQKRLVDVNALLGECVSLVENQALFHNIRIVKDLRDGVPPVVIDPSEMQQVFMNMILNAAEAMNGSGQLTLATRLDPDDNGIEVAISDTGHGISAEDMERVFDPFFTTKEVGHGTGLGLAISYGIVKEHSGTISVESEAGKGTTFTVRLPVAAEVAA